MILQDFPTVLEFADKVHLLGTKLHQDEQEIVHPIKAQMPPEIMSMTDLLDSFSKIHQKLMQVQNLKWAYHQPKPAGAATMVDLCFMQAYVSGDSQPQAQLRWNPQPPQGLASWSAQNPIQLSAWLNAGMLKSIVQEMSEAILNYVRAVNKNGRGMTKAQGPQKPFNPNARGTVCAELPGRMVKSDGMPLYCYNCQSEYHLAWDCPKNLNRWPQPPKYLNITWGNVSSRQNHVNVAQSGPNSSETTGSA